jgi:hypothetical protein
MLNLYDYLHLVFQKVINTAYPEVSTDKYSLHFFLSQNKINDLCTPIARQLSSLLNSTTAETIARQFVMRLDWDNTYLSPVNPETVVLDGFINFNIGDTYLQEILFQDRPDCKECTSPTFKNKSFNTIYEKLKRLLHHSTLSGMFDKIPERSSYELLTNSVEHTILVLLALSDFPDRDSGKLYFIKRLLTLSENYYNKTQLISKDKTVSAIRLLLIKRIVERIELHLHLCSEYRCE